MHREVSEIRSKQVSAPWPKFLRSITIDGLRGWNNQEVRFNFPVTVVSGENGSGKSTVLMAAAAAYKDPQRRITYSPSAFFRTTPWDASSSCSISYKIREGRNDRAYTFRKRERWRFSGRPEREVIFETIARTLPIENLAGYARIATSRAQEASTRNLDADLQRYYSAVLSRGYDHVRIAASDVDPTKDVGVVSFGGSEYSAFHQGAGEAATLDLMKRLEKVRDTALVVIDEVEASLHPRAQRRFVHFLLWLARTRHIQIVLSSHSKYVLDELPEEARIFLSRSPVGVDVLYGASSAFALSRMDDLRAPELYLYVEDREARELVGEILTAAEIDLTPLEIKEAGPKNMVASLGALASQGRLPMPVVGIVDGDASLSPGVIKIPGGDAPEKVIFSSLHALYQEELSKRLGIDEAAVVRGLYAAMTLPDHHDWLPHVAQQWNKNRDYIWTTMCQIWVKSMAEDADMIAFAEFIRERISGLKQS
ncbi:MAG: AAA family ATPase [bacterium]|nr:AAA family ATPase [bacterium]